MTAQPVFEAHTTADRVLTWDDLQTIPDGHFGYQLIGGTLLVTPSPGSAHQSAVLVLATLLRAARPAHMAVKIAPFDVVPAPGESYQPDILVARREDVGQLRMEVAPLLVVEVLSPSTRIIDLTSKRQTYAEMGVEHYWVVDPDEPSIRAFALRDGSYFEVGSASGSQEWITAEPFAVRVVPAEFLTE